MTENSIFDDLPPLEVVTASDWENLIQSHNNDTSEAFHDEAAASVMEQKHKKGKEKKRKDDLPKHVETKCVLCVTKILKDRVYRRRIKNDTNNDLLNEINKRHPEVIEAFQQIQKGPLSKLEAISQKILKIEKEVSDAGIRKMIATEEMRQRLLGIGKEIDSFDKECKMLSEKVESIQPNFCEEASGETLRKKFNSVFPEYSHEEIARSTDNQDQESLRTYTGATPTPLKQKLTSAAIPAVQNPSKKKKTSHRSTSPKALDLPPGEYVPLEGLFPPHNAVMDNMKTVLFEMMKPEISLFCQDQMFSLDARLQVLEAKAVPNGGREEEVAQSQNKVKILEIEKTDLMTQLYHANKEIRGLKKRLEASGASSSQPPTGS